MNASLSLDGYLMRRMLRRSGVGQVWLATRERDRMPVVVKSFTVEGDETLAARVRHEFELIRALEVPGVVKALTLERSGRDLVLVLEDHGGVNLREYANGRSLPIDEFLTIAVATAEILAQVHQRRVIHRDLKPTNILVDPRDGSVALADFGISVLLEREQGQIDAPAVIEGTLPYMAPEQTGRTGREVDFRSDLYALGATFYELLTGRPPFVAESPRELIHAHFARRPQAPQQLRPELPTALSQLVLKLLEKAPERRYQSARALASDLRRLQQLFVAGASCEGFELARDDAPTMLLLPHALYGRDAERQRLHAAFARAAVGAPQLLAIVGPPGIGKSTLLDELVEPVIAGGGSLARGRFDEQVSQPFSALITAVTSVIDQLLTESPEALAQWRVRLQTALAGCAGLITELIPRLAVLLDDDEPNVRLPPAETRTQVLLAFARLLAELARPEHPLVLVLDDLQWADRASIELLEKLLADGAAALLIVVTSRDLSEVDTGAADELISRLRARGREPELISLGPLELPALTQLLADALAQPHERVADLARIIARKTGSNPFFVRQILLMLVERGLLVRGADGWSWDADALERAALPEDVLEMLTDKLERLDAAQCKLLCVASVFGSEFEPTLLGRISGCAAVLDELQLLVDEGLIVSVGGYGYAFAHDRIRAAAYDSLARAQRRKLHLSAGEALLDRRKQLGLGAIFEIADHLNRGYGLTCTDLPIDSGGETSREGSGRLWEFKPEQLASLARINLQAGTLALRRGAPAPALVYLRTANYLFTELGWFVDTDLIACSDTRPVAARELRFEARLALAQAATLTHAFDEANAIFALLTSRMLAPERLARVAVARITQLVLSGRGAEVIGYGKQVLSELGVQLPAVVGRRHVLACLPRMARRMRAATLAQASAGDPVVDIRARAAMDVLQALAGITSILDAATYVVLIDRHTELLARHGDHPSRPQVYAAIATILANALGRRREGLELTEQCVALAQTSGGSTHRVAFQRASLRIWFDNLLDLADTYASLVDQSLEAGDVEVAEYAWMMRLELAFYGGLHLRTLDGLIQEWGRWSAQWGSGSSETGLAKVCTRLLDGPVPAAGELEPITSERTFGRGLGQLDIWVRQLLAAVLLGMFGRWREAATLLDDLGDKLERLVPGLWFDFMVPLFAGVAASVLASDRTLPLHQRIRHRRRLAQCRRQLARKCANGANFVHGELLLRAEVRRLAGDFVGASKLMLAARERAAAQRNPWFEGLVCERLGATAIEQGIERFGIAAIRDARECWLRWGAFAKVSALDEQWSQLIGQHDRDEQSAIPQLLPDSSSSTSRALDSATVLEASHAIAEDLELDEVIVRVMRLAVENVGAERGVLVLAQDGKLSVAAEYLAEGERAELLAPPQLLSEASERVPTQLLRWVARTAEPVVHDGAHVDMRFVTDTYLGARDRSILCAPIVKRGALIGLIYLENQLSTAAFTEARLETLGLLAAQAGNALDNARLYAELRASESRWRSLVEQLPDYVAIAERDGTLTAVSSKLGNHPTPMPMLDAEPGELERALAYVFATGGHCEFEVSRAPASAGPGVLVDKSTQLYFIVRVGPLAADGKVERALIVATDVSERRHAELAQQRYEAQLRQQQRLEAIGTLASGVAHEINNPIQGIMNYAELIGNTAAADAFIRELAGEIEHEGKRVATIIRNLLAFARQERGQDEPFQLTTVGEIVDETLSLVRTMLRKDTIDLRIELPDALPPVQCRSQQIQQVVLNLVTNARDALNARYPGEHPDKRIEITATPVRRGDEEWVRLSVSDQGGGVPEQVIGRIFDPFFTTKGRDRGTGLGLALSHGIVAEHGGILRLDNHPGESACFSIELHGA